MEMTHAQVRSSVVPEAASVTAADVVIGIATYNDADGIGQGLRAAQVACARLAGDATCILVQADGQSNDGTVDRALEVEATAAPLLQITYPLDAVDRLSGPYRGVPAKGSAVRAVFETARRLNAKVCAIVDVDVGQFADGWLDALVRPVLERDQDFVAPYYARHRLSGTINNGVAYPLMRALYGRRVRYPMGGDFACSTRFVDRCIAETPWEADPVKSAVDLWLTARALTDGSRVCQAMLGVKRQTWRDAGVDAAGPVARVLATIFAGADRWQTVWQKVRGSNPVPMFGAVDADDDTPVAVDVKRGIESFRLAQKNLDEIWKLVLPPRTLLELRKLALLPDASFRIPDDVWARIVYDFSLAYHQRALNREHVLSAFAPLFAGWVSSFAVEVQDGTPADSESRLDEMCLRFENEKPYLISRWRWPDRFSP
jgi:hypothetical protein